MNTDTRIAYSPNEVANMLGVTTQTVYRMISRGEILAVKVGTRNYRILARDLDNFIAQRHGFNVPTEAAQ
jgi:excisionase family DNA binding protein